MYASVGDLVQPACVHESHGASTQKRGDANPYGRAFLSHVLQAIMCFGALSLDVPDQGVIVPQQ